MAKQTVAPKYLTGSEFAVWMESRKLTLAEVSEYLGVSYQSVQGYRKSGVTRAQALAISAIEHGLKPWQPTEEDFQIAGKQSEEARECTPQENS